MSETNLEEFVFVSLGSNLGESPALLRQAAAVLQKLGTAPLLRSSLWASAPVDCPPGSPDFVNAAVGLQLAAEWTPDRFLDELQGLEREFGRGPKKVLNEARPLDLDIVLWKREIITKPRLTVPHPRARQRRFVLEPLAEIAPTLVWPGDGETVEALCARLRKADQHLTRVGHF